MKKEKNGEVEVPASLEEHEKVLEAHRARMELLGWHSTEKRTSPGPYPPGDEDTF